MIIHSYSNQWAILINQRTIRIGSSLQNQLVYNKLSIFFLYSHSQLEAKRAESYEKSKEFLEQTFNVCRQAHYSVIISLEKHFNKENWKILF